jgi:hypothetical protein
MHRIPITVLRRMQPGWPEMLPPGGLLVLVLVLVHGMEHSAVSQPPQRKQVSSQRAADLRCRIQDRCCAWPLEGPAGLSRLSSCVANTFAGCWEVAAAVSEVQEGLT